MGGIQVTGLLYMKDENGRMSSKWRQNETLIMWKNKPMNGRYVHRKPETTDRLKTWDWLTTNSLKRGDKGTDLWSTRADTNNQLHEIQKQVTWFVDL